MPPTHPGTHLREMLDQRGWSQADLVFVLGCQLKTGFIRMRNGSLVFSPGVLIPIISALCILVATIYKRVTWFMIATAAAAGLLAVMTGGYVLITF